MYPIIGISFSSRNRPDILDICLSQVYKFYSSEKYQYVISVVNDAGDAVWNEHYAVLMQKYPAVIWHQSRERLGVAGAKNKGIKILRENYCDHFFLFDDDAFPVKKDWEELYINAAVENKVHHLMHLFPLPQQVQLQRTANGINEYQQCCGVLLFFTTHAINIVGGFRKAFGIYGHEHTELSLRCNFAGLQPNWGPYISPEKTREYIYSLDMDFNNWGVPPPDSIAAHEIWHSSIQGENIQEYINYNSQFFGQMEPVYEEI